MKEHIKSWNDEKAQSSIPSVSSKRWQQIVFASIFWRWKRKLIGKSIQLAVSWKHKINWKM